ncbi:MAG: hypothetical protein RBU30_05610 [Polyangia bacterium]|nr:hypothetical protein [Polyangia bacterium]
MNSTHISSGRPARKGAPLAIFFLALSLASFLVGGCATRGITTRALENRPIVRCYERNCSAAEDSRAAAQGGCPSCVY